MASYIMYTSDVINRTMESVKNFFSWHAFVTVLGPCDGTEKTVAWGSECDALSRACRFRLGSDWCLTGAENTVPLQETIVNRASQEIPGTLYRTEVSLPYWQGSVIGSYSGSDLRVTSSHILLYQEGPFFYRWIREIWGSSGSDYKYCCHPNCDTVHPGIQIPSFRETILRWFIPVVSSVPVRIKPTSNQLKTTYNNNNNNNNNNKSNCKWAVTRWQWLLCMYINMK